MIGSLPAFLHVTFVETPPLIDAYAIGFFFFPAEHAHLQGLPEILGAFFNPRTVCSRCGSPS